MFYKFEYLQRVYTDASSPRCLRRIDKVEVTVTTQFEALNFLILLEESPRVKFWRTGFEISDLHFPISALRKLKTDFSPEDYCV